MSVGISDSVCVRVSISQFEEELHPEDAAGWEAPDLDVDSADRSSALSLLTILTEIAVIVASVLQMGRFPGLVAASIPLVKDDAETPR
jgi:hypothetical protein